MTEMWKRFSLEGKKALIVCPENPYGKEIAGGLAKAGAEIWLAGDPKKAEEMERNGEVYDFPVAGFFAYHHGDAQEAQELAQQVERKMERVDVLVENGLYTDQTGWKQTFEEIYEQLQKSHLGMMLTVQSLGHILADQGAGSVILVADYGALVGYDPVNYGRDEAEFARDFSLVKGFIAGGAVNYARQASNYLAEHGCRCNTLAFGPMEGTCAPTFAEQFVRHSQVKRLLKAEDVENAAVFLASDASAFITGVTLPVDGGYTAK